MADQPSTTDVPIVTHDPRFKAGRSLIQKGLAKDAVDIFATLLEETTSNYASNSIEVAPCYYEYGNALLRAASRAKAEEEGESADHSSKRMTKEEGEQVDDNNAKIPAKKEEGDDDDGLKGDVQDAGENNEEDETRKNDFDLALEMMENSYSIMDKFHEEGSSSEQTETKRYMKFVTDELPRVLSGIGDTLTELGRHADAADTYAKVLERRKAQLEEFDRKILSIEQLRARRLVCEATVLVAEQLLACNSDEDVVTTETKDLIVTADERVEYISGYYKEARDALANTVSYMGEVAAKMDLGYEKEDVCFVSTLLMGIGEALAEIEERAAADADANTTEPTKKKPKK